MEVSHAGCLLTYLKRHHLALLALFLASGGVSYAAVQLPAHSVGTKQLKNGAVTKKKIAAKTIKSLRGRRGPVGPQGLRWARSRDLRSARRFGRIPSGKSFRPTRRGKGTSSCSGMSRPR